MNKYDYYDNLKKYKKNYLQHAKSKLYGIQQDDHQYYKRIGEPGNYRYFYSKDQWDAYQKERAGMNGYEDWKKNQEAKETAKEKADMTGYEDWKKEEDKKKETERIKEEGRKNLEKKQSENKKSTESSSPTNFTDAKAQADRIAEKNIEINRSTGKSPTNLTDAKAEAERTKEKNRIAEVQKKIDYITENVSYDYIYESMKKVLKNTDEYKALEKIAKEAYLDKYNGTGEKAKDFKVKKYIDDLKNKYNFEQGNERIDYAIEDIMYEAALDGRVIANKILDTKNRDKEIANATLKNVTASLLNSDNPEDNQRGVNLELAKYTDYLNQSIKSVSEIKDNYFDYLTSMSILRQNEEKDPLNGLPMISTEMSIEETMRYINPGRQSGVTEIEGGGNCRLCTLALDLRMRGYDVSAPMYSDADSGFTAGDYNIKGIFLGIFQIEFDRKLSDRNGLNQMYKTKPEMIMDDDPVTLKEKVSKQVNSYGCFDVQWNDCDFGHAMFYTVDGDGNITIYDAQINEKQDLDEIFNESSEWRFTRTDNVEPDYEYIKEHNWIIYY